MRLQIVLNSGFYFGPKELFFFSVSVDFDYEDLTSHSFTPSLNASSASAVVIEALNL